MNLTLFSSLDWLALAVFVASWLAYTLFADHSRWSDKSLTNRINVYRERWMMEMVTRDLRMIDTTILGNLMTGIAFFASTAMLILGGIIALLGNPTLVTQSIKHLPYAVDSSPVVWEFKVLLLALIFVYAFFKFAWAFRLTNYCNIMVGSAPVKEADPIKLEQHAKRATKLSCRAGHHFNRGLRAFFFGSAALAWMFHPLALMLASLVVVIVLYRREFSSTALLVLQD
ncbi:DUF599 domain-containing protein [Kiloniella laminariae]|uniref:DUF599 domain-containing protein n=1 Tax=Kiloniella laminariae TaxID=454162 RepID=A0ABT4LG12_9PROT|nr:DUF599 domain-containing protein [Kiloniella laminariae]MCZ4280041.1 DUF599 domain-containing protein [Kiloniella laminariae]